MNHQPVQHPSCPRYKLASGQLLKQPHRTSLLSPLSPHLPPHLPTDQSFSIQFQSSSPSQSTHKHLTIHDDQLFRHGSLTSQTRPPDTSSSCQSLPPPPHPSPPHGTIFKTRASSKNSPSTSSPSNLAVTSAPPNSPPSSTSPSSGLLHPVLLTSGTTVYQLAPGCSISIETEDSSDATTTTTATLNLDENGVLTFADVAVNDFVNSALPTAMTTTAMTRAMTTAIDVATPSAAKTTTATIADDGTIYIPLL